MSETPTPEQVEKSIGMCRLHGLHNTEATLRALSAKLAEAEAERDAALELARDKEASADYWHQENRIQFEAKNKAKAERDALRAVIAYALTELGQSAQDIHAIRAEARLSRAARQKGGE